MKELKTLWLVAIFLAIACEKNSAQQEIEKWNAAFAAQKAACKSGNRSACETACQMSRSPKVCNTIARMVDMTDPGQRAWVEQCPVKALADGRSCCGLAADMADQLTDAPNRTSEPVSATPVVQNGARFDRIPSRGALPEVGRPVVEEQEGAGPAYFATNGSGLVKLDGNGFVAVLSEPKDLLQVIPGPKGELWLLSYNAIHRFEDNKLESFEGEGRSRGFNKIAVGPEGDVWITGLYGVSHFNGKTCKFTLNGNPAAKVEVEICPTVSRFTKSTPCHGQPFYGKAITDARGAFRIDRVPLALCKSLFVRRVIKNGLSRLEPVVRSALRKRPTILEASTLQRERLHFFLNKTDKFKL